MVGYIKGSKIVLEFDYDAEVVQLVRTLVGRKYYSDNEWKHWEVPASPQHAFDIVSKLRPHGWILSESC